MAESTKLEFFGDPSSMEAAFKKLQEENAKLKAGFGDTAKASVKGSKEASAGLDELAKYARSVSEQVKTSAERQAESLGKLRAAFNAGMISAQEFERAHKQIVGTSEQVATRTRAAAQTTDSFAMTAVQGLGGVAASWLSVSTAIGMVNTELENQIALQQRVSERSTTAGRAMESLATNIGGDIGQDQFRELVGSIRAIANSGGLLKSPDALMAASAGAVSSLGEVNPQKRIQRLNAMLQAVAPIVSDENAEGLLTVTAQAGEVTGAQTKEDFRKTLALVTSAQNMSPLKGFESMRFASRAAAKVLTHQGEGADVQEGFREALATWATLATFNKDITGEASATGTATLAEKLRSFMSQNSLKGGDTLSQRLAFIRSNPQYQEAFLKDVGSGADSGLFRKLLDPNSAASLKLAENIRAMGQTDEGALANIAGNLRATPQQQIANANAAIEQIQNQELERRGIRDARYSQARNVLFGPTGLPSMRGGSAAASFNRMEFEGAIALGYDPIEEARHIINERAKTVRGNFQLGMIGEEYGNEQLEISRSMLRALEAIQQQGQSTGVRESDAARNQRGTHAERP